MSDNNKRIASISIHLLLAMLVGMGGWGLLAMHNMAKDVATVVQCVADGREERKSLTIRMQKQEENYSQILSRLARIEAKIERLNL